MTVLLNQRILLIGAGKMGGALLAAWLRAGLKPQAVTVVEPDAAQAQKLAKDGIKVMQSAVEVSAAPDCIVLAVKPQSMNALLPELAKRFGGGTLYLSIAAGKTLTYFAKYLGDAPVVRAMPNTPALIDKGISALIANDRAGKAQKELATALLKAAGEVVWLEHESLMDAVTAISGSGPAYMFLFLESLVKVGVKEGLPEDIARKLAVTTMLGSAALAKDSNETLATLRENVTSPGGTTEAALRRFMENNNFDDLMKRAVGEAVRRSKELAQD